MIDISPEIIAIIMFGGVLLGVLSGFPLAIPLGAIALLVGYALDGTPVFDLIYGRVFALLKSYTLLAVPLFIFMGSMLERSGIAEKMYDALYVWLGGFKGGLAIVTVLIGTALAACLGIISASITMLTLVALPSMLRRGYNKSLAAGSICAGGTLGILIPPSVMLVIYGPMASISVGKLFMAAFFPGFLLSALYMTYITIRCLVQPKLTATVPSEERAIPFVKKTAILITSMVPPGLLILAVLGVIFMGIAPPTEAAAVGAFVATLLAIAYHRFNWRVLRETSLGTMRLTSMIFLIGVCGFAFVGVFLSAGCGSTVEDLILAAPGGRWGAFIAVMFLIFILGMFIDWIGILFIIIPIISPLAPALGFDPLWFAIMVCVNLQMAFLSPPFAPAIFILKGSAAPELEVTVGDIIRGVIPYIILIMIGLVLCVAFPEIILWLPGKMIK